MIGDMDMTHEELIKAKRRLGFTTAQISEETGIPVGTLNKLFSGVTKNPRRDTVVALEKFFLENDGRRGGNINYYYDIDPNKTLCVREGFTPEEFNWKPQGSYTIEDYKKLPEGTRIELIDGCLYVEETPTFTHQMMAAEVHNQIEEYIKKKKGKCFVTDFAINVYLTENENTAVIPDLFVLCDRSKITEHGLHGAPDFVLEVLSKSTRAKDLFRKASKYGAAGVKQMWCIDPVEKILYDYAFDAQIPIDIRPLTGKRKITIFDDLEIDLDRVADAVRRFYE